MTSYTISSELCISTTGDEFGTISIGGDTANYTHITCTDQVVGDTTFTLPATAPTAGQILTMGDGGISAWDSMSLPLVRAWVISDYRDPGSPSGSFVAGGWRTRSLNTIKGLSSTTNNNIQLAVAPANVNELLISNGTYMITAYACAAKVDRHKLRVQNLTDGVTEIVGSSEECNPIDGQSYSRAIGTLIVTDGPKVYAIEHYCTTSADVDGFGLEAEDTDEGSEMGPTQQVGVSIITFL